VSHGGAGEAVGPSPAEAARLAPVQPVLETPLADVLPTLLARHHMQLALMRGDNEARLFEAFDGLAGLARW